ncbi:type II secretion system minor pseudopilin GspK [Methylovulum sp.]|nr:type II secretion system minor pseudopilin GspK [Methylovulum sp.]
MALLTVLFILAIASIALVAMSSSRQLDIRRTENLLRSAQGMDTVYGLESWAGSILSKDRRDNKSDSYEESWARVLPETAMPGGGMTAALEDLQGRFNLNNLLVDGEPSGLDVDRLRRLYSSLKINPASIDAILDWLDTDSEIRYPNGAEDETYLRTATPYRSGNRLFADASELLLIKGISRTDYQRLKPYIFVADQYTPININTADPLVLRSLAEGFPDKDASSLAQAIKQRPFASIEEFINHETVAPLGIGTQGLNVGSHYFALSSRVQIGKILLIFDSQLKRTDNGEVTVIKRQRRSPEHG